MGARAVGAVEELQDTATLFGLGLLPFVVAAKSRGLWLAIGFAFPPLWLIPAFRLAQPESMWARGVYDDDLRDRAAARFAAEERRDISRVLMAIVLAVVTASMIVYVLLPVLESV